MQTNTLYIDPIELQQPTVAADSSAPLDPEDWESLRLLGHRMVDDMLEHLRTIRDQPVWQPVPESVGSRLKTSVPEEGIGAESAYEEFLKDILPYSIGNTHPRFWGWVIGSGTPLGALSDMLAAAMNPNVSGLRGSPPLVEDQVLAWLQQLLGFSKDGSGLLVSGASMANILGLAVAVDARAGDQVARRGLALSSRRPVLYTSTQAHLSVEKGVRMLGLGTDSLRKIPVDSEYRIDLEALRVAIENDLVVGLHPFCIVANAGTVNTGAFDDLDALADLAEHHNLWLHVDGAFGAFATFDPDSRHLVDGLHRADSLAFDLHKWMVAPIEAGAVLFKDAQAHRDAFKVTASYVSSMSGGIGENGTSHTDRGPQMSRNFRALKIWMSLKAHGASAYRELVQRNIRQARHLVELVENAPNLELLAPAPLNVVCFRYHEPGSSNEVLNRLNRDIVVQLQEDGIAAPSHTTLEDRFAIRACFVNHRTQNEDIDLMVEWVLKIGQAATGQAATSRSAP
jgi:aromatic-L-amino-acid decarboxylase